MKRAGRKVISRGCRAIKEADANANAPGLLNFQIKTEN